MVLKTVQIWNHTKWALFFRILSKYVGLNHVEERDLFVSYTVALKIMIVLRWTSYNKITWLQFKYIFYLIISSLWWIIYKYNILIFKNNTLNLVWELTKIKSHSICKLPLFFALLLVLLLLFWIWLFYLF